MASLPWRTRVDAGQAGNMSGLDSAEFDVLLGPFPHHKRSPINAYDSKSCVWFIKEPSDLTEENLWSAAPGQHLCLTTSFKISPSSPEMQGALRELLTSSVCTLAFSLAEHGEAISRILLDLPESSALRHLRISLLGLRNRTDAALSLMAALKGSPWKVRGLVFERSSMELQDYTRAKLDDLAGLALPLLLRKLAEAMLELPSLQCVGFMWFEYFFPYASLFAQFFKTLGEMLTSPCLNIRALSFYESHLQPSTLEALLSKPHKLTRLDLIFGASRPDLHLSSVPELVIAMGYETEQAFQRSPILPVSANLKALSSIQDLAIGMDYETVRALIQQSSILHVSANLKALRLSLPRDYTECFSALRVFQESELLLKVPHLQMLEFHLGLGYAHPSETRVIFVELSILCRSVLLNRPTNAIHSLIIRGDRVEPVERGLLVAKIVKAAAD